MNYWLYLSTGTTWNELRKSGATISGFRTPMRNVAAKIQPGDILVCYLTGVMRWVGVLVVARATDDQTKIWRNEAFPVRSEIKPLILRDQEPGVPMAELEGKVAFDSGPKERGKFKGFVRMSSNRFSNPKDDEHFFPLLKQAQTTAVARPVDPKKLARKPLYTDEKIREKQQSQRRSVSLSLTKRKSRRARRLLRPSRKPQRQHATLRFNTTSPHWAWTWASTSGLRAMTVTGNGNARRPASFRVWSPNCPPNSTK